MANLALIVDDHRPIREAVRELLQLHLPDCEVIQAEDGEQAMALAIHHRPDLMLVDIHLPYVSGIELTERVKRMRSDTVVIAVSWEAEETFRRLAFEAGVSAYVCKDKVFDGLPPLLAGLCGSN